MASSPPHRHTNHTIPSRMRENKPIILELLLGILGLCAKGHPIPKMRKLRSHTVRKQNGNSDPDLLAPREIALSQEQLQSVQLLGHVQLFATPWTVARQASLSLTNSRSLLEHMSIESVMPSNHFILCHPLLPLSIFPSIGVFSNELALRIRWPKYWSFSFIISPSNEYLGLISFRTDRFDLLAVQGTLKGLLRHHVYPNNGPKRPCGNIPCGTNFPAPWPLSPEGPGSAVRGRGHTQVAFRSPCP